jgi:hypothetical protein
MMFDLDDETDTHSRDNTEIPYVEATAPRPIRARPTRRANGVDVSASFPALRPASLPVPSALNALNLRTTVPADKGSSVLRADSDSEELDELAEFRQAELMKMLAARTPSHRAAWKRNNQAWQRFIRKQRQVLDERGYQTIERSRIDPTGNGKNFGAQIQDKLFTCFQMMTTFLFLDPWPYRSIPI